MSQAKITGFDRQKQSIGGEHEGLGEGRKGRESEEEDMKGREAAFCSREAMFSVGLKNG